MTLGADPVRSGEQMKFMIVVSNTAANSQLDNVFVALPVPPGVFFNPFDARPTALSCSTNDCSPGETATWELGTLGAGESRLIIIDAEVIGGQVDGTLITANAIGSSTDFSTPAAAEAAVVVENEPAVRMEMAATPSPAVPAIASVYCCVS